jgi:hypothetical protein
MESSMMEISSVSLLDIKIYDEDIQNFKDLVKKLLYEIKKPGFKKLFNENQVTLILQIAESLGLELRDVNINASDDLIK